MEITSKRIDLSDAAAKRAFKCLALSTLCEHPKRRTGLTTYFRGLVTAGGNLYQDIHWIVFESQEDDWSETDQRVRIVRRFPANDRLLPRLWADHFQVSAAAREMNADALLTVGFVPLRKMLPTIM